MTIKPVAHTVHFASRPDEREVAVRLDEAFDVSSGNTHGQLSYWILEPTSRTKARFGLQKEILAIYSEHASTDARVLTAIETLTRTPELRNRTDKVVFLVIHNGDHAATVALVKGDKERVIVPLAIGELLDPGKGVHLIRSRMSEFLGAVDLFGVASPITSDLYFFGRTELVHQLTRRSAIQRENSGLFGLRKTGKTSVLYAIRRAVERHDVVAEYFDCQNPGIHNGRWWQVLGNITLGISEAVRRRAGGSLKPAPALRLPYVPETAGTAFAADIKALLATAAGSKGLLIILDEIEWVTPGVSGVLGAHWDKDFVPFWQSIRATHQETEGRLTFLLAGVNPASAQKPYFENVQNPIHQLAQPHYLHPFPVESVREMVRTIGKYAGLTFSESIYEELRRQYGGHPYLIRIACSEVWRQNKPTGVDVPSAIGTQQLADARPMILARLAAPIKDILLSLVWWYPEEYSLLQILASGDTAFVSDYLNSHPGSLLQFEQYGLLEAGGAGFAIRDIQDFLSRFGDEYKREISPFQRTDISPELLPIVPDIARLGVLFSRKTELECALRKLIVMFLGVKTSFAPDRMAALISDGLLKVDGRPDPKALFVGREPRDVVHGLYTLDLKAIIGTHWTTFQNVFGNDRSRFEMNMDTVNVARQADSHSKPVTDAEFAAFENSYQWLLMHVSKIPTG